MNVSKKIVFATEDETVSPVFSALRSEFGLSIDPGTICSTELADFDCWIYSPTHPILASGDIVYNTNNQTSPFDGENKYFKLSNGTNSYVVLIDNSGVVSVSDLCL